MKLIFYMLSLCICNKFTGRCFITAGTWRPYSGRLCTVASDEQRERACRELLHRYNGLKDKFWEYLSNNKRVRR